MSTALAPAPVSAALVEQLRGTARRDFEFWRAIIEPLLGLQRGINPTLRRAAAAHGLSFFTLRKRYYHARAHGLAALIDLRLCGAGAWKRKARTVTVKESPGLLDLWKRLCEEHHRSAVSAHKELKKLWRQRAPEIGEIPEYRDFPGWPKVPRGWTYDNLMHHRPSDFELAAARQGRFAASLLRPTVFTTRSGLYVGSHYMFDDKWHDMFVNSFAERQAGRPLEVYSLDVFAACKRRWGVRVRTKDEAGAYKGVAEVMMRYILAATLHLDGYSPRGTIIIAEKGTAKVREQLARLLHDKTGGLITVSEGGMTGLPANPGQYPGLARGNPRHKAALESNNNLEHNRLDAIPGQTGRNRDERPDELAGRLDHNARLLAALDRLPPAKAALLQEPLLELNQWLDVVGHIYAEIADDREHELEGWIEAGHVTQLIELGGVLVPLGQLTAQQREALPALLQAGLVQARPARMSRREAWERGARDLMRLPGWGVCAILGDDLAREVSIRDNMFEVVDQEIGPSPFRYEPTIRDAEGRIVHLRDGEKFQVFINPFAPDTLFVRDAHSAYLGESRRIIAASRADVEAIQRAIGDAMRRESDLLAPQRARHARGAGATRLARHRHNARVLADAAAEATTRQAAQSASAIDLLLARAGDENDEG